MVQEIRLGEDVWDSIVPASGPEPVKTSRVIWTGPNNPKEPNGKQAQIFLTTWENPFPNVTLESIDFISALNEPVPYLYAITAEP